MQVSGVSLAVDFLIRGRYRYGFWSEPSDENGEVRISYEQMESSRHENALFFLMDYNTPLDECDEAMRVHLRDAEELREMHEKASRWFKDPESTKRRDDRMNGPNKLFHSASLEFELEEAGATIVELECRLVD